MIEAEKEVVGGILVGRGHVQKRVPWRQIGGRAQLLLSEGHS